MIVHLPDRCNRCGGCAAVCPVDAIVIVDTVRIDDDICNLCGNCVSVCPFEALSLSSMEKEATSPESFDIVVVGGGSAGVSAAFYAAKSGASVLLIEKHRALDTPLLCAEGVSFEGLSLAFEPRDSWVATSIEGAYLVHPNGKRTVVHHPRAGFVLRRRVMLREIAARAASHGAVIRLGAMAVALDMDSRNITAVRYTHDGIERSALAAVVIAADGIESKVGQMAGLTSAFAPSDVHSAAQFVMGGIPVDVGYPEFYLGRDVAPGGYGWVFPQGDSIANVGVGIDPVGAEHTAIWYLDKLLKKRAPTAQILERTGGLVPASGPMKELVRGNLVLIGDAAHLTDPLSGGGISPAIVSGKMAGIIAAEAVASGNINLLMKYPAHFKKLLGWKYYFYKRLRKLFVKLNDDDLEAICRFVESQFGGRTVTAIDVPAAMRDILLSHTKLLKLITKL